VYLVLCCQLENRVVDVSHVVIVMYS
jgi:hypothetical protein